MTQALNIQWGHFVYNVQHDLQKLKGKKGVKMWGWLLYQWDLKRKKYNEKDSQIVNVLCLCVPATNRPYGKLKSDHGKISS